MRVSLEAIGLTSLFGLPWVLKFLWGPQIDQFGTKRRWMLSMQLLLIILVISVAFLAPLQGGIKIIAILFFIGSFVAATHDMAIDGYYMEALDEKGQARFVGYRVMAYRIAMMTGTGIIVTIGATKDWLIGYLSAGILILILFIYHLFFLPKVEKEKDPISNFIKVFLRFKALFPLLSIMAALIILWWTFTLGWFQHFKTRFPILDRISFSGWIGIGLLVGLMLLSIFKEKIKGILLGSKESFYSRAFISYMDRDKIGVVLAFIILMRAGESMLASMASPFMVDLGIKVHYGWISGGVGLPFSIIGAMVGGWMISQYTLKKTLWPFLLAQNMTNIIYMLLALFLNRYIIINTGADTVVPLGSYNLFLVASVHAFDQFAGGLGTSVLVTFLMRTCLSDFKAAHFAIGTGLMNISGVLSGVISGFLAEWLGYWPFFGISFIASIPGMIVVFFLPQFQTNSGEGKPLKTQKN